MSRSGLSNLLSLTEAGRNTLAAALPIWRDTHAEVEARLDTDGANELRASLLALS